MSVLADWLGEVWVILARSGPYLLIGFLIAGLLETLVPRRWVSAHLGRSDLWAVTKAALVGAPVPLCSCSVLPTAAQLRRGGASPGATTSFLIATPETGVDSVGITWALIDPLMTVARPVAAIATAIAAGAAVNAVGDAAGATAADGEAGCGADHAHDGPARRGGRLRRAGAYAYGPLMADLTPWLIVGFALSAVIALGVPAGFFGQVVPDGWPAMLAMLVIGAPMYVCATSSTPVAAALMTKGLDPGAALVFLLAGPATNLATMGVVRKLLGGRALLTYLAAILVLALLAGLAIDRLYPLLGLDPTAVMADVAPEAIGPVATAGGALLALLLAWHAARLLRAWRRRV